MKKEIKEETKTQGELNLPIQRNIILINIIPCG